MTRRVVIRDLRRARSGGLVSRCVLGRSPELIARPPTQSAERLAQLPGAIERNRPMPELMPLERTQESIPLGPQRGRSITWDVPHREDDRHVERDCDVTDTT